MRKACLRHTALCDVTPLDLFLLDLLPRLPLGLPAQGLKVQASLPWAPLGALEWAVMPRSKLRLALRQA